MSNFESTLCGEARKTGRILPTGGRSSRGAEGGAAETPGTAGAGTIIGNKSTASISA